MKHKQLSSLLAVLMSMVAGVASAYDAEIGGIYYNLVSKAKQAEVTSGDSEYTGNVTIPSSVTYEGKTYTVTSIGSEAFYYNSGLTSVSIGNSVTSIGNHAFEGCDGLTSITIPESVTSIGNAAFRGCTGLTSITIPNSVTSIGRDAFSGCTGLTSVTISNSVTSIGSYAFEYCSGLTSVTIPNSVTSIGDYAFSDCTGLTSVTIPNSVISIGESAFYGCTGLTSVTIPNSVTSIGEAAFFSCSGLTSVTIPNSVTSIGSFAFAGCSGLTSVTIGNSVTEIGYAAFNGCTGLTSVTIPNSVTSIGEIAFQNCSGLITINIGSGIKSIDSQAFANCANLEEVYCLAENVPSTQSNAFDGSLVEYATLYVPEGSIEAYKSTVPWSNFGTKATIDGTVPVVTELALQDGDGYNTGYDQDVQTLTYTRTFSNTDWQALYVPFEMTYADWQADFEVARLNDVHQWDDDDDGTIDRTELEAVKLKSGKTEANTPYLIRAKSTGEKTITLTNATLYKAEENSFDVSSWNTKFTFTGTYSGVSGADMFTNGYYAMGGGRLHQAESSAYDLSPMRWYMTVTDRNGNPKSLGEVKVMFFDTTDGISPTENAEKTENTEVFDLSGRRTDRPTKKGVYIKNGRKMIVR